MDHSSARFLERAHWLSYLGLIPFVIGMLLMILLHDTRLVAEAIHDYAAIILTFVGAIHWGRALNNGDTAQMSFSVIPSLIAWCSLFLDPREGLPVTAAAFVMLLVFERNLYLEIDWFKRLRTRITILVCTLLSVSWFYI
ncbi:MAG: hypothetical protein B6D77_03700 [gamma proteobacterium symbiont of Ctena orbiculata]|nr:MAG: hypothetical protein B6D77_03700 [gamma proteobacterium symbiont of Ctena orbiculata]PVV23787.1 MAG: hypothetical protein B6D78_02455 [gamma proteobacterium symbiont of Ctena orbiculata]